MDGREQKLFWLISVVFLCLTPILSHAKEQHLPKLKYSPNINGILGLNNIPNARMDKTGNIRLGISTSDPYWHSFLGIQIAEPLYISLRQSAEISNIKNDPDKLYPGIDFKLRILEEKHNRPAIALGVQSANGHKRMGGEYITLSKTLGNFDLTAGIGWGRFGSSAKIDNPLAAVHSHFDKKRPLDGETPVKTHNWFTGENIGFFAGIEYFPDFLKKLSFKFDWGGNQYEAEKISFDYKAPSPWSAGISYTPLSWLNLNFGTQGSDKLFGRLSLQRNIKKWRNQSYNSGIKAEIAPLRGSVAKPEKAEVYARENGSLLYNNKTDSQYSESANLYLRKGNSTPSQLSDAAVYMANYAGEDIEQLNIIPTIMNLRGPKVRLMRKDIEAALRNREGSAQEIWQNTKFLPSLPTEKKYKSQKWYLGLTDFSLNFKNQISLSEEDSGILYRTSLIAGINRPSKISVLDIGYSFILNIKDNLSKLSTLRPIKFLPIRSNVQDFANRTFALNTLYGTYTSSLSSDLHLALTGGYLEEMYAAFGGEILYRPFASRLALGAEAWQSLKRDPDTSMNMGLSGDHILSGHINAWYDLPQWDITTKVSIGRYLAEDTGATIGLMKTYRNGAKLEGFLTLTDTTDSDLFGSKTYTHQGIRLTLPLGGYHKALQGSDIEILASPFGRDVGEKLKKPFDLYDVTQAFSKQHIIENWREITP